MKSTSAASCCENRASKEPSVAFSPDSVNPCSINFFFACSNNLVNSSSLNTFTRSAVFSLGKGTSSIARGSSTSVLIVASLYDSLILSIAAIYLGAKVLAPLNSNEAILSVCLKISSTPPISFKRQIAVFTPAPFIPGMLSESSPFKAR